MSAWEKNLDFWGSFSGSNAYTGEVRSPAFRGPHILQCFLSGYPGKPGLDLYLERESDHLRFALTLPGNSFPGETWRRYYWWLPPSMRGHQVSLVAVDHSQDSIGWFGVSTPCRFSFLALLHQQLPSNILMLGHFLLNFALFLLPGFAVTCFLAVKWPAALRYTLITVVVTSASLGYLAFYIFFFSKTAGELFVFSIYVLSVALIGFTIGARRAFRGIVKEIAEPFAITAATALCYLSFTFLFVNPATTGADYLDGRFFDHQIPGDNVIPRIFAEKIYNQEPLRPFCCGGWLSSDRPPLQTGIFLMELPLSRTGTVDLNYQLLATGLECLWICAVWTLLTSLGVSVVQIRRALAILIFSGFIFYNSVYTWPKLLAGSLVLFFISILIMLVRSRRAATYLDALAASLCLGLALVSHPGSLFSLITVPILVLRFRHLFPIRKIIFSSLILLMFVLPWAAYQKFVDPPGNRLVKWHLAGDMGIDSSSPLEAIRKAYFSHTYREIVAFRLSNIRVLFGSRPFDISGLQDVTVRDGFGINRAASELSRIAEREFLWNALGLLNAGWLAALFLMFRRRRRPAFPFAGWMLLAVAVDMLFWCLVEFGPDFTIMATSSFADFLMLSLGLLAFILALPDGFIIAILLLQIINFFVVWVWSPPYAFNAWAGTAFSVSLQLPLLIFGVLLALFLLARLCRSFIPRRTPTAGYKAVALQS